MVPVRQINNIVFANKIHEREQKILVAEIFSRKSILTIVTLPMVQMSQNVSTHCFNLVTKGYQATIF